MSYRKLVLDHPRFLAFGIALTFFSSFGQTFFIALFSEPIREAFSLSHGGFGVCYSLATLTSGLSLIWIGRKIDTIDLRLFTAALCAGLTVAAFLMASVNSVVMLVIAIFMLRLTGQGLFGHTAATTMARYFDSARGKALSISQLGYPAAEAAMPILTVIAIERLGWRSTWMMIGVILVVGVTPLIMWLLKGHAQRHEMHLLRLQARIENERISGQAIGIDAASDSRVLMKDWTCREVLGDRRFYLMLPAILAPGFIVTGFFFHQVHLVETKGWGLTYFAACFAAFAGAQLPAGLLAGLLVDRFSARRLMSLFLSPLALGLVVLASGDHFLIAPIFLILIGLTAGVSGTVVGSMWAEIYGVTHLGAIRAMATSIMVLGTAGSPILIGLLVDRGVSFEAIAAAAAGWCVMGMVGAWAAMRVRPR